MARVKGSKQHELVIKPHQPMKRFVWFAGGGLGIILVLLLGFLFGQAYEREQQSLSPDERYKLEQLELRLAELEQSQIVDQLAVESARQSLMEKQEKISQLERDVTFYKGVMMPDDAQNGLRVGRFTINKMEQVSHFRLKWSLTQAGKNADYLTGETRVELIGMLAGNKKVLSLSDLAKEKPKLPFKFRYFQNFSVQIELPNQFVVEKVVLSATSTGKQAETISQQFDWVVQGI